MTSGLKDETSNKATQATKTMAKTVEDDERPYLIPLEVESEKDVEHERYRRFRIWVRCRGRRRRIKFKMADGPLLVSRLLKMV